MKSNYFVYDLKTLSRRRARQLYTLLRAHRMEVFGRYHDRGSREKPAGWFIRGGEVGYRDPVQIPRKSRAAVAAFLRRLAQASEGFKELRAAIAKATDSSPPAQ